MTRLRSCASWILLAATVFFGAAGCSNNVSDAPGDNADGGDDGSGGDGGGGGDDGSGGGGDGSAATVLLAPSWRTDLPGIGAFMHAASAGDRVAVLSARVGGTTDPIVVAAGRPGEITLPDYAQHAVMWLDRADGSVAEGRVLAARTSTVIGGLSSIAGFATDHAGGVIVGGGFVGETRFHPGSSATRVEQAVVQSMSPGAAIAHDPFVTGFDAAGAPLGFVRGTTTGSITQTHFNIVDSVAALPGGGRLVAGWRQSQQLAFAGTPLSTGTTTFLARVESDGQLAWLRQNIGGRLEAHAAPGGQSYLVVTLSGDATMFAGTADELALEMPASGRRFAVARLESDGTLSWTRQLTASTYGEVHASALANGDLLITAAYVPAATYELGDVGGAATLSGSVAARSTLVLRLAPDGSVRFASTVPASLTCVVDLDNGELVALATWYTDALPAELAGIALPAGTHPTDDTVHGLVTLDASGAKRAMSIVGMNLDSPASVATPGGAVVAAGYDAVGSTPYVVDDNGAWLALPICAYAQCLTVGSFAVR
jgi:hypothetical protein